PRSLALLRRPPNPPLCPYTTLFRSPTWGYNGSFGGPTLRATNGERVRVYVTNELDEVTTAHWHGMKLPAKTDGGPHQPIAPGDRSEEHTSELQSRENLVCRLLLEKK